MLPCVTEGRPSEWEVSIPTKTHDAEGVGLWRIAAAGAGLLLLLLAILSLLLLLFSMAWVVAECSNKTGCSYVPIVALSILMVTVHIFFIRLGWRLVVRPKAVFRRLRKSGSLPP